MKRAGLRVLGVALLLSCAAAVAGQAEEVIRQGVEQIRAQKEFRVGDARIASVSVLPEFYERRNFSPAWTDANNVKQLLALIRGTEQDGLHPGDYHLAAIEQLQAQGDNDPRRLAQLDLLLTDALIRIGYHFKYGKVDPEALDPHWNMAADAFNGDPVALVAKALESGTVETTLNGLKPSGPFYKRLRKALARYREIQAAGGWSPVPDGPTLKKDMRDARVVALRERLKVTGDFAGTSADPEFFDEALEQALKAFQKRHGLQDDGAAGKDTIAALSVPVEKRIDQLRLSLERVRWVFPQVEEDMIVVNIAGYEMFVAKGGELVWKSQVQVGKPYRKTPVFGAEMKYLVLNPTWTVPPTILRKDYLPKLRKDPNYLVPKNIRVLDSSGNSVDPESVDWANYKGGYTFRQDPGPKNALGRVKFMFPNKHLVYLHDTPYKQGFERDQRTFSSGCIRVQNPFALAELLLNDPGKWSQEKIQQVIDSKETRTVHLKKPIKVMMLYLTAGMRPDGTIYFFRDVYERDQKVLKALNGEFKFRKRPVVVEPQAG